MIKDIFSVTDIETLKVISDPLRIQILDTIRLANDHGEFRTVKQLSEILDLPTSKLYYHISMLEKFGLIQVGETQMVSGIVEKHYQVTAHDIIIDRQLFATGVEQDDKVKAMVSILDTTLEATRADYLSMLNAIGTEQESPANVDGRRGYIARMLTRLTQKQFDEFFARFSALVQEFDRLEADSDEETFVFNLTAVLLPTKQDSAQITNQGENPKND